MHMCASARICVHVHMHLAPNPNAKCLRICTQMHACIRICMRIRACVRICTPMQAYALICMHAHEYAYACAHMLAYARIYLMHPAQHPNAKSQRQIPTPHPNAKPPPGQVTIQKPDAELAVANAKLLVEVTPRDGPAAKHLQNQRKRDFNVKSNFQRQTFSNANGLHW